MALTEERAAGLDLAALSPAEHAALRELARLAEGLTREQCAARLGVSRQYVAHVEARALVKLRRLAEAPTQRDIIDRALERARAAGR